MPVLRVLVLVCAAGDGTGTAKPLRTNLGVHRPAEGDRLRANPTWGALTAAALVVLAVAVALAS